MDLIHGKLKFYGIYHGILDPVIKANASVQEIFGVLRLIGGILGPICSSKGVIVKRLEQIVTSLGLLHVFMVHVFLM